MTLAPAIMAGLRLAQVPMELAHQSSEVMSPPLMTSSDDMLGMTSVMGAKGGPSGWSNAITAGFVYGTVHVVGPDHLGTLMTLAVAASKEGAFRVGAMWGLGHSFGMVLIGVIFCIFHGIVKFNVESWEHVGDYVVGVSMILCAIYFFLRESQFLERKSDGTYVQKGCACHGPGGHQEATTSHHAASHLMAPATFSRDSSNSSKSSSNRVRFRGCSDPGCTDDACDDAEAVLSCAECVTPEMEPEPEDDEEAERMPLVPKGDNATDSEPADGAGEWKSFGSRDVNGWCLGMVQGICCPIGMIGISFLAKLKALEVLGFLLTFLVVSTFGTASLALGWAHLTSRGIGVSISPRAVYRASCFFTMSLGVTWIIANATGVLEKLDYTAGMHGHD
mmetsp:Transcript_84550/g.217826  ORF Transcript_84550/g.217826 Transcript_84550/m.217826 type:complete len:391 (+) Transcript_84550:87-1259(+)